MKPIIALAAAAAIALAATPALAKSKKKKVRVHHGHYGQVYVPGPYWGAPGNDPSVGHPSAATLSRLSGRCVEDLGYGRYKYCGW